MSATTIIDNAPLGALIRYTDGSPKPPARFTKKLAAWKRSNGMGRLVKKEPPRAYPTWTAPASFTLHKGNFASDRVILVTIMRSHSADSQLTFEVAEEPKPRQVRVLLEFGGDISETRDVIGNAVKPIIVRAHCFGKGVTNFIATICLLDKRPIMLVSFRLFRGITPVFIQRHLAHSSWPQDWPEA
jgi:hypothetical protein